MVDKQQNKIHRLNNSYVKEQGQLAAQAAVVKQRRRNRAMVILGVFAAFVLLFTYQIIHAKANLAQTQVQVAKQKSKIKQKTTKQKQLNTKVKQLNDPDYCEKIIRNRYYYTKSGETVYTFPSDVSKDVNDK